MAYITELRLTGPGKKDANVRFKPGPNVVSGDSDTGKSYILKCIDYVLGAEEMTKVIEEASGYELVWLELANGKGDFLTLERHLSGGDVRAYAEPVESVLTRITQKSETHGDGTPETEADVQLNGAEILTWKRQGKSNARDVTSRIFPFFGMNDEILLRTNDKGKTQRLSIRTLLPVFVKGEADMIIEKQSPILGDGYNQTAKKRMLSYLLTGLDDSSIIFQDNNIAKTKIQAKLALVEQWLGPVEDRLESRDEASEETESIFRLDEVIENLSLSLSNNESKINTLQDKKRVAIKQKQYSESQLIAIGELLGRYSLLEQRYKSDLDRLDFISEGSHYFNSLQSARCPCCGQDISELHQCDREDDGNMLGTDIVYKAARAEAAKIQGLQRDLHLAITDLKTRHNNRKNEIIIATSELETIENHLNSVLTPIRARTKSTLDELVKRRLDLQSSQSDRDELSKLLSLKDKLESELLDSSDKQKWAPIDSRAISGLCRSIEFVLKEWSWDDNVRVEFEDSMYDIIINGKTRRSHGQGYRAIFTAAYLIGLLNFCHSNNKPHPGFVILDTPVDALKQREGQHSKPRNIEENKLDPRVEPCFWKSLSEFNTEIQVIILENKEPPPSIAPAVNLQLFVGPTGGPDERKGFIPD